MKNIALLIALLIPVILCHGQTQKISEAGIRFDLPNSSWSLKNKQEKNNLTIYFYKRVPITDNESRQVIPNISFIVETVPDTTDIVVYSMQKRSVVPFDIKEVFTYQDKNPKINHKYAIGYKGTYTDKGGLPHTVYIVHLINKDKGVQVFFDATTEVFPFCESEFLKAMRSITNINEAADKRHLTTETIKPGK